jgi:hypothetical protein
MQLIRSLMKNMMFDFAFGRLSMVAEVESTVEVGLARASLLRQAVLRSAFEGRL